MKSLQSPRPGQYAAKFSAVCLVLLITAGCSAPHSTDSNKPDSDTVAIDKTISANDINPAIYFNTDDPNDPFAEVYAGFRERRANDMADARKPPPIAPYPSAHPAKSRRWVPLHKVLPFDWANLRLQAATEATQLEQSVKARIALDHPDIKIVELILGPGATLPAHAGGSPGFYYVVGGSGEINVEGLTHTVSPGTTVKLHPYDIRRVYANVGAPLKIIWIRWAPGGDQKYLAAGYYLTGANQHIQPQQAELPWDFEYWGAHYTSAAIATPASPSASKGFFRAKRPDGGWDFNISQMVWGPRSRYVEHSHSIPEFYYMMSGPVEHWVGEQKYVAMPGDVYLTNSYQTHQSRGIVDGLPFRNIGASWAPNGDRSVFNRPFYLVEPLPAQPQNSLLPDRPQFP